MHALDLQGGIPDAALTVYLVDVTERSVSEGDYRGADDMFFVIQRIHALGRGKVAKEDFLAAYDTPGLSEWARHALVGSLEVGIAWHHRGGGWAGTVTEEGWKKFGEHLEIVRDHLGKAWKLRPERPEAAAEMIAVTMPGTADRAKRSGSGSTARSRRNSTTGRPTSVSCGRTGPAGAAATN